MKTAITILADNCVSRTGLIGEHGFSALIEKGDEKFLFDTGQQAAAELAAHFGDRFILASTGIVFEF